ncbi:PHP domain-containing protein [Allostreptomyces psammosilenae]|uniref:Polymerase/histidinol phosphatase N-terminal domain-containing protein n=1 Tax=Allostreptomyces psammosilenae TaxID=1892865 RepID=A0A853A8X1_9ACTN|nr:PHP domain-containing protein [Allostreptomyces psammosilenae]NYI06872.1 hypothetical protein [Allostreptomyces psammosilenae]
MHSHPHTHDHGHSHPHGHQHGEGHDHDHAGDVPPVEVPAWADTSVPERELSPAQQSRRRFVRNAGLLGAGAAAFTGLAATPAAAKPNTATSGNGSDGDETPLIFLAGDHHVHTQFSSDGLYRVSDQARRAAEYGLDWLVITDHGSATHAKLGVELVNPEIREARTANPRMLLFQGLEWNIPAAEHGTVFVAPGDNEVATLKAFELGYDGSVNNASDGTPGGPNTARNEALAIAGLQFLAKERGTSVRDALMLANHPARKGIDSPHEIRAWRDAAPEIAVGMEGAPGHQAAALPIPGHEDSGRGLYDSSPSAASFPGYPLESYITYGGFDWMTSTVGGLWDSLLAEGKPWWISANSDSHQVYADTLVRGAFEPGQTFNSLGQYPDPVDSGTPRLGENDFFPGYYSRTNVGVTGFGYLELMAALRAGRVWVDHGHLIDGLDVRVREKGKDVLGVPLGGTLSVRRGRQVELVITIDTASRPNLNGDLPKLARVDVIQGAVTGPVADRDTFTAPRASVVKSVDVSGRTGRIVLRTTFRAEDSFYLRLRGTDGNRSMPGLMGAKVDPNGPAADVRGNADPWKDLWFYANPIFVDVTRR